MIKEKKNENKTKLSEMCRENCFLVLCVIFVFLHRNKRRCYMKRIFLSTILLSFIITGCKKDNDTFVEDQKNEEPQQTLVTDGVVGGRYQFSSSESLSKMMGELRNDEELLEKKMKELK